ncbi:alpha-E domain-containing protein [uncultured Megasphaera sp.]|uniref:alpha-E domain-containing protein n=1 Tax=uncultured Megasphaera sp. TaxID=165188 RepID=UPI00265978D8|nr:alpha-E domain-containing protein [uncultured Megasphaera sp.]
MDIISVDKVDNLLWLGRYSERVYITIREFFRGYDRMIENPDFYIQYCQNFQIPNIYTSLDDFVQRYVKDETDMNSIVSNLNRAYDNCIVLRNELGSETMSYLELSLDSLKSIEDFHSFIMDLQGTLDYILAFWACLDDNVQNYEIRNIVKLGKRLERLDMYLRLRKPVDELTMACETLDHRLKKSKIPYDRESFLKARRLIYSDPVEYVRAITQVERII